MKTYGLDKQVFQKQAISRLQTQQADTFHEQEIRKAMKEEGLSDKTIAHVLLNLHERKMNNA